MIDVPWGFDYNSAENISLMALVLYVSGHGLGHATREITILQSLPREIPLIIKTASPEWHWRNELAGRRFEYVNASFDVGTVQRDSLDSDARATLAAWHEAEATNKGRFDGERDYLLRHGAKLVVSDVPSFPLAVAASIGIPSVCVANFTWADIYADLIGEEPAFADVAERLREEYSQATLHLDAGFSLPMTYFPRRESVGIVARTGNERRSELLNALPASARGKRLALVYVGNWGLPIPYARLSDFEEWHFLSLGRPGNELPENWSVLPRTLMAHPDLVASVDVVVSKVGYGLVGECLTGGTPILYCPRTGFAEYPVIDAYLSARLHGIRISVEQFTSGDWGEILDNVPPRGAVPKEAAPGGLKASNRLAALYNAL
ncbi:MAG: hypothetical protein H7145_23710 [Akkermansiaceae bacterium]|nr:hypothetical protein [Armatimonadota bacterium]